MTDCSPEKYFDMCLAYPSQGSSWAMYVLIKAVCSGLTTPFGHVLPGLSMAVWLINLLSIHIYSEDHDDVAYSSEV